MLIATISLYSMPIVCIYHQKCYPINWSPFLLTPPPPPPPPPPEQQNGRHFRAQHVYFKRIFLDGNITISIKIPLKNIPMGSNDNKSALVRVKAWRRTGDKPLPEQMLTQFTDAYMRHWGRWLMAFCMHHWPLCVVGHIIVTICWRFNYDHGNSHLSMILYAKYRANHVHFTRFRLELASFAVDKALRYFVPQ